MTVKFGFYNSLNGDRKYNAEDISSLFKGIINDGVFQSVGAGLAVTSNSNMTVTVGEGRAWFNGTWTDNDEALILTIQPSNTTLHRKDSIILEVNTDLGTRTNTIKVLTGTPASVAYPPTLVNSGTLHQYSLATIGVPATSTSIPVGQIVNNIGTASTPFITGPLETLNLETIFGLLLTSAVTLNDANQAAFDDWFSLIKGQLSTDAAGNLQNQINYISDQESGWIPSPGPFAFSSVDAQTGTLLLSGDQRSAFAYKRKIRYTQSISVAFYWPFDVNGNPTVGSTAMTVYGLPTYTAGKFSNALTLNGSSALGASDSALLKPTGEFSIGMHFKNTGAVGAAQTLFHSGSDNPNSSGITIYTTSTGALEVKIGHNDLDTYTITTCSGNFRDSNNHKLLVTFRNKLLRILVDGVLIKSSYCEAPGYEGTNYVRIGCKALAGSNAEYFVGQIDDLFLIHYGLSSQFEMSSFETNAALAGLPLSITKYAIVSKVALDVSGNTLVTAYHGVESALMDSSITQPFYSVVSSPVGFPSDRESWSVLFKNVVSVTQTYPVASTNYNIGGQSIVLPIGEWDLDTSYLAQISATVVGSFRTFLSESPTLETTQEYAISQTIMVVGMNRFPVVVTYRVSTVTKKTLYLNFMASQAGQTSIVFLNASMPTELKAYSTLLN
jgi:hypothetical protein